MDVRDQLEILKTAQQSPALLALATVDFAYPTLPAAERNRLKDALLATAVPHWCDAGFLAALLKVPGEEASRSIGELRALTVVEPFPARGAHAVNVHEATRLALREHLRTTDRDRWTTWSSRARDYVGSGTQPHARIEALYHLFAVDQQAAAAACEALDREFELARPEIRYALSAALGELKNSGWLDDLAEVEATLPGLRVRVWRGDAAVLEPDARRIVQIARKISAHSALSRALFLLGDTLTRKGRFDDALGAYREGLATTQALSETEPTNVTWKGDVAGAYVAVGDAHLEQGRTSEAAGMYQQSRSILQALRLSDPHNIAWQRDLGVVECKLGDIALVKERFDEAAAAFEQFMATARSLAAADPSNTRWQRELGVAYSRTGDVALARGHTGDARTAFHEYCTAFEKLAATDPSNSDYQRELGVAYSRIGDLANNEDRLDEALDAYRRRLDIFQRLVSAHPGNADWQREVAIAHNQVGQALRKSGNEESARMSFEAAVTAMEQLIETSQPVAGWKRDLETLKTWVTASDSK